MDLSANRHRMMIKFLCFIEELASKASEEEVAFRLWKAKALLAMDLR